MSQNNSGEKTHLAQPTQKSNEMYSNMATIEKKINMCDHVYTPLIL